MEIDINQVAKHVTQQRSYRRNLSIMAERLNIDIDVLNNEMLEMLEDEIVINVLEECNAVEYLF